MSISYCIPYVLIAIVLFLLYIQEQNNIKAKRDTSLQSWSAFWILAIFLGLRGHLYTDFVSYYPFYEKLTPIYESGGFDHYFEPGFVIYSKIIKTIIPNYFGWVFVNTAIDLLALRFLFKRYCFSSILPFIFFLAFQGVVMESNLMRNMKALDCFFFSIPFLFDRKIGKYMALNLLGATFHTSALIFIPLYWILTKTFPKVLVWGGLIFVTVIYWGNLHITSSFIGLLLGGGAASERAVEYISQGQSYGFTFGYFERTLTILLFVLSYRNLIKERSTNNLFFNCSFLYYFFHIFFDDVAILAQRMSIIFIIGNWMLYANIFKCRFKYRPIVILYVTLLISAKIVLSYSNIGAKYQNVLFGVDSFEKRAPEVMEQALEFENSRR